MKHSPGAMIVHAGRDLARRRALCLLILIVSGAAACADPGPTPPSQATPGVNIRVCPRNG